MLESPIKTLKTKAKTTKLYVISKNFLWIPLKEKKRTFFAFIFVFKQSSWGLSLLMIWNFRSCATMWQSCHSPVLGPWSLRLRAQLGNWWKRQICGPQPNPVGKAKEINFFFQKSLSNPYIRVEIWNNYTLKEIEIS